MIRFLRHAFLCLALLSTTVFVPSPAAADAIRGGLLWDQWWVVNGAPVPTGDHPLYPPAGSKSGNATFRCKECHGWDYKGAAGAYGSGSHFTGIAGVFGTTLTAGQMTDLIKTVAVANGHGFQNYGLTDTDIADLVEFIQTGVIDTDFYIDGSKAFFGDASQGETNYSAVSAPACTLCHGAEGTAINFKVPADPEWVGTLGAGNPWELLHKIRFGQPGTGMPSWIGDGGSDQGAADMGAYVQQNLPAFSLCTDTPRAACAQSAKATVLIKKPVDPSKAKLKFKWVKGAEVQHADFGDPGVTTNYSLCLYDSNVSIDSLAAAIDVRPNPAWLSQSPKGWKYKDKLGAYAGLRKALLKPGTTGKSKATFIAKGVNLALPVAVGAGTFFGQDPDVTVQLVNESEQCWTATFATAKKNEAEIFKAKQP